MRQLSIADAAGFHAGEDGEQRRWFAVPEPAPLANVVAAIERWRASWAGGGPSRHWGIWVDGGSVVAGGVEIRLAGGGAVVGLTDGAPRRSAAATASTFGRRDQLAPASRAQPLAWRKGSG